MFTIVKKKYKKITTFDKHTNLTMAVAFLDNHTAISGGGDNSEIYVWDIKTQNIKTKIAGTGQRVGSVGYEGENIAWGNKDCGSTNCQNLQKSFNLTSLVLGTDALVSAQGTILFSTFKRINSDGLSHAQGGDYGFGNAVLTIGSTGASITKDAYTGYRHRCYGWYKGLIVSGGSGGHLKIYDTKGVEVASLVGHTGEVWSIALDGDRLVSGSDDQTIKVWDLAQLNMNSEKQTIKPLLSLFVGSDDEWVMWSDEGYYNASLRGDRFIKWHINQGADKEALSYPVGRFKEKYYQPELFGYMLDGFTLSEALAKVGKKEQKVSISESLPPYLTFAEYPEKNTNDGTVNLKVRVISKSEITNYKYLFDGRPLENTRALKPILENDTITLSLALPKQSGTLSIQAQNRFGYSEPVEYKINYLGKAQNVLKPKLYVLAIGVSKYDDKEIALEYASKDANDFANVWKKQKNKLYSDVVVKTLTDKEATKDNILDGLDWIQHETTSRDVVMVFIAGHGVNDESGNFYFLPVNFDDSKLKRTGIAFSDFKNTLSSIAGKVVLFADACHSGNIMGKRRSVDVTGFVQELNDAENGVVIFASSTGKQYSLEDKAWNNGAFTKAVVEGVDGKADLLGSGKITVDSLSVYVSERVKKLTNGKQTPTGSKPTTIADFPIWVK